MASASAGPSASASGDGDDGGFQFDEVLAKYGIREDKEMLYHGAVLRGKIEVINSQSLSFKAICHNREHETVVESTT